MNIAIVKSSELGANCWLRFLGHECKGLETCTKTEKKTCKAWVQKNKVTIVKRKLFANGSIVEEGSEKIGGKE